MKYVAIAVGVYILVNLVWVVGKEVGRQEAEKEFAFVLNETLNALTNVIPKDKKVEKDSEDYSKRTEKMSKLAEQMAKEGYSNEDILKALEKIR